MFSTDLARIRQQVREGALSRLGAKPGRKVEQVSTEAYEKLRRLTTKYSAAAARYSAFCHTNAP